MNILVHINTSVWFLIEELAVRLLWSERFSKRKIGVVAQIDSLHNTASYISRKPMVQEISAELTNQIGKILKEGVSVGNLLSASRQRYPKPEQSIAPVFIA